MSVLVAISEDNCRDHVMGALHEASFEVACGSTAGQIERHLLRSDYDLVVASCVDPYEDIVEFARFLFGVDRELTLIAVHPPADSDLAATLLDLGASDAVPADIGERELVSRCRVAVSRSYSGRRRRRTDNIQKNSTAIGPFEYDALGQRLRRADGTIVSLSSGEATLLSVLVNWAGTPVSRQHLCRKVYRRLRSGDDRRIDMMVSRLRQKLEDNAADPEFIKTARGVGYFLVPNSAGPCMGDTSVPAVTCANGEDRSGRSAELTQTDWPDLQRVPVPMIVVDQRLEIIDASPSFKKLLLDHQGATDSLMLDSLFGRLVNDAGGLQPIGVHDFPPPTGRMRVRFRTCEGTDEDVERRRTFELVSSSAAESNAGTPYVVAVQDVGWQIHLPKRVARAEQQLREVLEYASDWIWETDEHIRIRHVSDGILDSAGLRPAEVAGCLLSDIDGLEWTADSIARYPDIIKEQKPFRDLKFLIKENGVPKRYGLVSGGPVYKEGEFAGFRGIAKIQINPLMAAEAESVKKDVLQECISSVEDALVIYDNRDRLLIWNEKFEEYYYTVREEMRPGISFVDLMSLSVRRGQYPEAIGREDEFIAERIAWHRLAAGAFEQQLENGRWVLIKERRTASGYTFGLRTDITELKNREVELEKKSTRDMLLLDSAPGIICLLDATGRLIEWNRRLVELTAITGSRLRQTAFPALFRSMERATVREHLDRCRDSGRVRFVAPLLGAARSAFGFDWHLERMGRDDQHGGVRIVVHGLPVDRPGCEPEAVLREGLNDTRSPAE